MLVSAADFPLSQGEPASGQVNIHFDLGKALEPGEEDVAGNVHRVDYSADNKGANVLCR